MEAMLSSFAQRNQHDVDPPKASEFSALQTTVPQRRQNFQCLDACTENRCQR